MADIICDMPLYLYPMPSIHYWNHNMPKDNYPTEWQLPNSLPDNKPTSKALSKILMNTSIVLEIVSILSILFSLLG